MSDRRAIAMVLLIFAVLVSAGFGSKRLMRGDATMASAAFVVAGGLFAVLLVVRMIARRK